MSGDEERFDALLMNVAQTQRGIEPLLDTVFSFLRRKTDFFSGAQQETIEKTVLQSVRKQAALAEKDQYARKQAEEEKKRRLREKQQAAEQLKRQKQQQHQLEQKAAAAAGEAPRFEEVTDEEAQQIQKQAAPKVAEESAQPTDGKDAEDDNEPGT